MLGHGIAAIRTHLLALPDMRGASVETLRENYDKAEYVFECPADVEVDTVTLGAVPSEVLTPGEVVDGRTVLYLHGGGYALGSPRSHRHLAADIASAASARAYLIDYRRAPEHPYPAALDDAIEAYEALLAKGVDASKIVIAGDSAGGGLCAATLVALRDRDIALPAGGVCISPWTDLTNSAASYVSMADLDPMVSIEDIKRWTEAYLGSCSPTEPLASPAHAALEGLPSLLIQVGEHEVLLDDAKLLATRAEAAGVDVTLEVWDDMIHVWHWFGGYLDEAGAAVQRIARFVEARTA
jgi:phosphinothricin tripeptide acetyl hydrolase